MLRTGAASIWLEVVAHSAAIAVGLLVSYGALVRGRRLRAPMRQRVPLGVLGVALLYFSIHSLARVLTR